MSSNTVRDCKQDGHEFGVWTTAGGTTCRWCSTPLVPLREIDYPVLGKIRNTNPDIEEAEARAPSWVANPEFFEDVSLEDAQAGLDCYAPEGIALIGFVAARDNFRFAVEAAIRAEQSEAVRALIEAAESAYVRLAAFVDEDGWARHCAECGATGDLGDPEPPMPHEEGCALAAIGAALAPFLPTEESK